VPGKTLPFTLSKLNYLCDVSPCFRKPNSSHLLYYRPTRRDRRRTMLCITCLVESSSDCDAPMVPLIYL